MSVITAPAPMTGAHTKRAANNTVPDARAPSFHLQQTTISDEKLSRGESATVTLRFSQAIDARSFSLDDLVVGGGARLSNLYSTDGGTTWKVTLTAPGVQDSPANPSDARDSSGNQISVNLAGMTDLAGNAGVGRAVSTMTYDIDVRRPTATITLADSLLTAGETATVTFTFS
ncbi:Ig-like domain-containing protein, partial [Verminephrobacter aporrectodeae]